MAKKIKTDTDRLPLISIVKNHFPIDFTKIVLFFLFKKNNILFFKLNFLKDQYLIHISVQIIVVDSLL